VLIPLAPPGINFTDFYVSDVRVCWMNLLSLDANPIVLEIETVRTAAAELTAGSEAEVEELITQWLDVCGGVQPVPFQGRYPLLDGATFRVRNVELNIASPTRYGNLSLVLSDVEVMATDAEGRQRDLNLLCKDGLDEHERTITFSRLVECGQASVRYSEVMPGEGVRYLLDPTPVTAVYTQKYSAEDMRRVLEQRWTLSFPGPTRILTLPPLLEPAPESPPGDPRLFPFPAPSAEWHVRFADGFPFQWHFSRFPTQSPRMHPIAAAVFTVLLIASVLACAVDLSPRPWLQRMLLASRRLFFG